MKRQTVWLTAALITMLALLSGGAGALRAQTTPEATVAGRINYQGRLTDPRGVPFGGTFPMRFQIYDAATMGTMLWDSGIVNVEVDDGLFNVALDVNPAHFDGQALWLRIYVNGEWLSPRQELMPVPYALSLRPGAIIEGEPAASDGAVLWVNMVGDYPVAKAVWASATSGEAIRGESEDGPGVYGFSGDDIGVYGETGGQSTTDYGVYGAAGGLGYGVYGYQSASATGGLGVYGKNEGPGSGVSGNNDGNGNGTWGYSVGYNGVAGATNRADSNYGLYTGDNLYSANFHSLGAVMQIVQNGGDEPLEMGDVVAIARLGTSPAEGLPAVIQVHKANAANSTAVMGVVASNYPAEWLTDPASIDATGATGRDEPIPEARPGPIAPGEYLLVVVRGPCQVKADAVAGSIQPGNLLASGQKAGYAARAPEVSIEGVTMAVPGTILGKALESLDGGQKLLYVYITLQ